MLIRCYIAANQNLKHHRIGTATIKNENPFLKKEFQNRFFPQARVEEIDEEKGLSNDNAGIQNKGKEKLSDEKTPLLTGAPGKEEEGSDSENYGTLSA